MMYSKLSFAFENSHEHNYVTEKVWQPLKMGAIPIMRSPLHSRHQLPCPDSAIYVEDFDSVELLSQYIREVTLNETLWLKHTSWKRKNFSQGFSNAARNSLASLACRVCETYQVNFPAPTLTRMMIDPLLKQCVQDLFSKSNLPVILPRIDERFSLDGVFVPHYTKLTHRKATMKERVRQWVGVEPVFVDQFDKEELTDEVNFCVNNREVQQKFILRHTTDGENSLSMKHFLIFYHIVKMGLQNVIVMEDDAVLFNKDFLSPESEWQIIFRDLPEDYDIVMMSKFFEYRHQGAAAGPHLVLAQQSEVTSMYLVSNKGARNMLRTLPLVGPIDFQINYAGGHGVSPDIPKPDVVDMKIFHAEPPLSGQYDSTGTARTVV